MFSRSLSPAALLPPFPAAPIVPQLPTPPIAAHRPHVARAALYNQVFGNHLFIKHPLQASHTLTSYPRSRPFTRLFVLCLGTIPVTSHFINHRSCFTPHTIAFVKHSYYIVVGVTHTLFTYLPLITTLTPHVTSQVRDPCDARGSVVLCPQRGSEELMTSAGASSTNGAVTLSDNNNDAKKVSRTARRCGGEWE